MEPVKKVLIVDDSPISRQVIRNYLKRQRPAWQVYDSDNAIDALEMIGQIRPDYITMDVNMPEMSGLDAAEKIVARHAGIRLTLITANIQNSTVERALELGVGFIEKPIKEDSVKKAVEFFEQVD